MPEASMRLRRILNTLIIAGFAFIFYFLIGNALHWRANGTAFVLSGICFVIGILIRLFGRLE